MDDIKISLFYAIHWYDEALMHAARFVDTAMHT